MNGQPKYTVMELAELVGVPRTTINDWLGRHSQYIDFRMQGRRRIYTDASVKVLREISALRNSGLSSFDIEAELAKRHPVRGEPENASHHDPHSEEGLGEGPSGAGASAGDGSRPNEDFALIAKRQSDEIGRMLGESFQSMARKIDEIERRNRQMDAKAMRWYAVSLILLALILAAGFVAILKIESFAAANNALKTELSGKDAKARELEEKVVSLAGGADELKRNIEALEMGLVKQRSDFERTVNENMLKAESSKEAEVAKLRDKFAAERLELLKRIEDSSGSAAEKGALLEELKRKLSAQEAVIKSLEEAKGKEPQPEKTAPASPSPAEGAPL